LHLKNGLNGFVFADNRTTGSVTAVLPLPDQCCGTVCLNSFGNQTSPLHR